MYVLCMCVYVWLDFQKGLTHTSNFLNLKICNSDCGWPGDVKIHGNTV